MILGVVGLLVVAGSTAQAGWLFVLAAGVAGLLGGSLFVPQRLRSYRLGRVMPEEAVAGSDLYVTVTAFNTSVRPSPLARLEDRFPGLEPAVYACERIPPGGTAEARLARRAPKRGIYEGGEILVSAGAPFGFMHSRMRVKVPSRLTVVPRWVDLSWFPILEPASAPHDVLHERARVGAGEEYMGVRPYRPGDPRRSVHWRSSARLGSLVVKEYEEHVQTRVTLVLAGVEAGEAPDSAFETLVTAAASVAVYALLTGHPIEIVMGGSEGPRRLVMPSRTGMLRWLAEAEPSDVALGALTADAVRSAGRRGTVILFVSSDGLPGQGISDALRSVQSAGARGLAVVADSGSWQEGGAASFDPRSVAAGRSAVRVIRRGEDLRSCLQG